MYIGILSQARKGYLYYFLPRHQSLATLTYGLGNNALVINISDNLYIKIGLYPHLSAVSNILYIPFFVVFTTDTPLPFYFAISSDLG